MLHSLVDLFDTLGRAALLVLALFTTIVFGLVLVAVVVVLLVVDLVGFPYVWPLVAAFIVLAAWIPWKEGFGKSVLTGKALDDVKTAPDRWFRVLAVHLMIVLTLQALLILTAAFAVLTAGLHERGRVGAGG